MAAADDKTRILKNVFVIAVAGIVILAVKVCVFKAVCVPAATLPECTNSAGFAKTPLLL